MPRRQGVVTAPASVQVIPFPPPPPAVPAVPRDDAWAARTMEMSMSTDERRAVNTYTGSEFGEINGYLRGTRQDVRGSDELFSRDTIDATVRRLDAVIARSEIPEPVIVYRGVRDMTFSVGDVITDKGFQSTTLNRDLAYQFAGAILTSGPENIVLEIELPVGTRALYASGVAGGRPRRSRSGSASSSGRRTSR
jgi:hypothetical protein